MTLNISMGRQAIVVQDELRNGLLPHIVKWLYFRNIHNHKGKSLYKIIVLHLNAPTPLPPNSSSASPGLVPVVRPGVRYPDDPRS
jgi:hypothetical protein